MDEMHAKRVNICDFDNKNVLKTNRAIHFKKTYMRKHEGIHVKLWGDMFCITIAGNLLNENLKL